MKPFIKLEEPQFQNLPTREEAKRFEEYMRRNVTASNMLGTNFDGSSYFQQAAPDDLAFVFEKALEKWCQSHSGPLYRTFTKEVSCKLDKDGCIIPHTIEETYVDAETVSDICDYLERNLYAALWEVIQNHLKRTNGKIGHFPYSGERVLLTFDDDGTKYQVKLDPFKITTPEANIWALEETAKINDPAKKAAKDPVAPFEKRISKRRKLLGISAAVLLAAVLVQLITNRIMEYDNPQLLSTITTALSTSLLVSTFCCISILRAKREIRYIRMAERNYGPVHEQFESHTINMGVHDYQTYTQSRFEREVKIVHKYYRFMQVWANASGRRFYFGGFYHDIAPFVINKEQIRPFL